MDRRNFVLNTAGALASPILLPWHALGMRGGYSANSRIQVGFIGCGARGQWLQRYFDLPEAQIVAVADCHLTLCEEAKAKHSGGGKWRVYQDYRRMIEKEKLDCVFIETTTHARVLIAIHAAQAGLDVYGEKPLTLTVAEGRVLANVMTSHQRIFQTGTQQRSMPCNIYSNKLVREGAIGKIREVIVRNFESGLEWTPMAPQPVPEGMNWDLWCNQTELRPYSDGLVQRMGWAKYRDYDGGGQSRGVTGWGAHSFDQVQAALGMSGSGPVEAWPEEPGHNCRVTLRYRSGVLLKLEHPNLPIAETYVGENGTIRNDRGKFETDLPELKKGAPDPTPQGYGEDLAHLKNFFDCMRTRKRPHADAEVGHRSTTVCHLINICRTLGRKVRWDPEAEKFVADQEANRFLCRQRRKGYELPAGSAV
jgi:predicted dehydrogenase